MIKGFGGRTCLMKISSGTCSVLEKAGFLSFTRLSWSQLDQAGFVFARKSARCCECLGSPQSPLSSPRGCCLSDWLREGQKRQHLGFSLGGRPWTYAVTQLDISGSLRERLESRAWSRYF